MKLKDLEGLRPFAATAAQKQKLDAIIAADGNVTKAAETLGICRGTLTKTVDRVKRKAARAGHSPEHDMSHTVPDGFHVKGVSTMYGPEGEVRTQWVKTQADKEHRLELLMGALETFLEPMRGLAEPLPAPTHADSDLLCVYPMGDPHLGMYSWGEETGQDFNLEIAERNLIGAVDQLVDLAPAAHTAFVVNLGDFFHADNPSNTTARSNNVLDVDTRWPKVYRTGIRTMRRVIDRALLKHQRVRVVCEIGNHDDMSALTLALSLEGLYENEPRVEVDTSPAPFHWLRFGKNLIGVHHGHNVKANDLPSIMANDRAKDWGETKHRYWYTGHVHHDTTKEYRGCVVETFRTLAARDSWHNAQGYRSGRDMKVDILHREWGRINRHIIGIDQVIRQQGENDGNGGESV